MGRNHRRDFLKLCAASIPALVLANGVAAEADEAKNGRPAQPAYRTPKSLERYIDPLPLLHRLAPHGTRKNIPQYRVRMLEVSHRMHSQLPPTKVWGYEGQYPGPTFEAERGKPIDVLWENQLPTQHIFAIDPHIHGAMPPAPAVRTVPHLHGSRRRPPRRGPAEEVVSP